MSKWEEVDKQVMSCRGDIVEIEMWDEGKGKGRSGGIGFKEENKEWQERIFGKSEGKSKSKASKGVKV